MGFSLSDAFNYTPAGLLYNHVVKPFVHGSDIAGPPGGLTGPPPDPSRLQHNADGTALDPVTGQTYVNTPTGFVAQGTPNVAQQVATNTNRAAGFFNQVPLYDQREQTAYDREGDLATYLNNVATGNGPSVAGAQLAAGQDQAARQQLAQAAGASGNNAALSRLIAMNNTAGLQAATNQQQALARTQEERDALAQLAGVTGNMEQQSMGMGGQKLTAADSLNHLATQGEIGREGLAIDASKASADNQNGRWKMLFNGAGNLASGAGTA